MYIIIIFKSLLLPNPLADQSQIFKETSVYEGGTNVLHEQNGHHGHIW